MFLIDFYVTRIFVLNRIEQISLKKVWQERKETVEVIWAGSPTPNHKIQS